MEFSEVVRRRRMVRSYTDEPVDPSLVERALDHATRAPNAGFSQGWTFVVLDTPADTRRFWEASTDRVEDPDRWLAGMMRAPVVIVPCSIKAAYLDRYTESDKGWTDRAEKRWPMPFWDLDTAMASLLILQTVTDAGLGACFFGIVTEREREVRQALGLPDDGDPHPIGAITIGHPAPRSTGATGSASRRRRTPWNEVAHRGRYGAGWQ
ncbi:nitroreductase family protein [Nocardioides stalactiti]|uniref:nitroreductase family protein n=1 Tax=Nocardioides stalactiti TaxID=2755356 RepID=UPI001601A1A4|nr:nitroreductase family protein [Nocardioides stalactiti]